MAIMAIGAIVTFVCCIEATLTWAQVATDPVGSLSLVMGEPFNITCYSSTVFTGWKAIYNNGESVVKLATPDITELVPGITMKLKASKTSILNGISTNKSLEALECFSMALDWSEIFTTTIYIDNTDLPTTKIKTLYWPLLTIIAVVIVIVIVTIGLIVHCKRHGALQKPIDEYQHQHLPKKMKEPICIVEIPDGENEEDEEMNYLPPPKQFRSVGTLCPPNSNLGPIVVTAYVHEYTFENDSELPPAPVRIRPSFSEESLLRIVPAEPEVRRNINMINYGEDYYEIECNDIGIQFPEPDSKIYEGDTSVAISMEDEEIEKDNAAYKEDNSEAEIVMTGAHSKEVVEWANNTESEYKIYFKN